MQAVFCANPKCRFHREYEGTKVQFVSQTTGRRESVEREQFVVPGRDYMFFCTICSGAVKTIIKAHANNTPTSNNDSQRGSKSLTE